MPENIKKDPITVKHSELERWSKDSIYKSKCPVCKDGVLLILRNKQLELEQFDVCIACGQGVYYEDIEDLRSREKAR